tara:strand:+ start:128 stop:433 length:306 start_codon:yes stop_codon:yes gene_type:complete
MLEAEDLIKAVKIWYEVGTDIEPDDMKVSRDVGALQEVGNVWIGIQGAFHAMMYYDGENDEFEAYPNLDAGSNKKEMEDPHSIVAAIEQGWRDAGFKVRER